MNDLLQDIIVNHIITSAVRNIPNPRLLEDESENDSDKTIVVLTGHIYKILWAFVEFVADAAAGNRQFQVDIVDTSDDVIFSTLSANLQIASTTEYYLISPNGQEPKETIATRHFLPIPPDLFLPSDYKIRFYDSAAIASAADEMIVHMMVNDFNLSSYD